MVDNSEIEIAEFEHYERVRNPEDLRLIFEFVKNPNLEENKIGITNYFARMNMDINADDLAKSIEKYIPLFSLKNLI